MEEKTLWTPRPVIIALAQFAMVEDPDVNLDTACHFIAEAAACKADIVCLPELFRSPYFCRFEHSERDYSEPINGVVSERLSQAAKKHKIAVIGGSIYEKTPDGHKFNTSLVLDRQGSVLGTYRKVHIPHDPQFYECNYFEPGDLGFKVFDLGFAKVSVLICYDQWFPEAARAVALAGAEIIFYPTAIGRVDGLPTPEGDWQNAWETVQKGHAVANNVVVAPVNRVGREGDSIFWGGSFICDGFGNMMAKGGTRAGLAVAQVDLGLSRFARDGWRFFESRRPEQYKALIG